MSLTFALLLIAAPEVVVSPLVGPRGVECAQNISEAMSTSATVLAWPADAPAVGSFPRAQSVLTKNKVPFDVVLLGRSLGQKLIVQAFNVLRHFV